MRKLILGVGMVVLGKVLGRGGPSGFRGLLSLRSLAAMLAGAAATELLNSEKGKKGTAPAPVGPN